MAGNLSVKVAIRVRPAENETEKDVIDVIQENSAIVVNEGENKHSFTFDHVFSTRTTQSDIYNKCVKPVINNILKGYNVTILAYGQTSTGKTHTMGTSYDAEGDFGVIPRTVIDIFELARDHFSYDCKITVSLLEIFEENVYDLLADKPKRQCVLDVIRDGRQEGFSVSGLTEVTANSTRNVLDLLQRGSRNRASESTVTNANISKSHAIFTVNITMNHKTDKKENKTAKLLLVDLAGTEKRDGARKNVSNNGLSVLRKVIDCLTENREMQDGNIPYEDSTLTKILKESFGGNSITLMLACVSPIEKNLKETLSTLEYASRARRIENKPTVHQDHIFHQTSNHVATPGEKELLKQEINSLQTKIDELNNQLSSALHDVMILQDSNKELKKTLEDQKKMNQQIILLKEQHAKKIKDLQMKYEKDIELKNKKIIQKEEENRTIREEMEYFMLLYPGDENKKISDDTKSPPHTKKGAQDKKSKRKGKPLDNGIDKILVSEETNKENRLIKDSRRRSGSVRISELSPVKEEEIPRRKAPTSRKILAEKQKIKTKQEEKGTINEDEPSKQTTCGCTCKTDCSRKICGCKKIGRDCDSSCKCKREICRNQKQVQDNHGKENIEGSELAVVDGIKRKKRTNGNIPKSKVK